MNIAIIGLGYVGVVTGTCLSSLGHKTYGCDISKKKVKLLLGGSMPFMEPGCEELLDDSLSGNFIDFTTDINLCLSKAEIAIVCVGTPSNDDGSVNLNYIKNVASQIGEYLRNHDKYIGICIRSTVPVGTIRKTIMPILEKKSGKILGKDYSIAFCPEFLREGNAVKDFFYPPLTVVASTDKKIETKMENLWRTLPGEFTLLKVSFEEAEMCKYTSNAFHALKISFANEIGLLSNRFGADGNKVMEILVSDKSLNISPKYLKPGFAFGGSCLPKDIRALKAMSEDCNTELPLIKSILPSNESIINATFIKIFDQGEGTIGFSGITFKDGTDDLRESAILKLIYKLSKEGKKIVIYDKNINPEIYTGVNLKIWKRLLAVVNPILGKDIKNFIDNSQTLIISYFKDDVMNYLNKNRLTRKIFQLN